MIEARDLVKKFGKRRVVDGVSLEVGAGEVVGLLGSNGAGKTTTFSMLVGLVKPSQGKILFDGRPIGHLPMHRRARLGLGYLAQEPSVFRHLTVEQNLRLVWQETKLPRQQQDEMLEKLVDEFALHKVLTDNGISLSGGERRRVEIARALAVRPRFLLLDEPFTGIDPIAVGEIQDIISRLKERGMGILITDHNVRETLAIVDRAYIIREGTILLTGDAPTISASPVARKFYLGEKYQTGFEGVPALR